MHCSRSLTLHILRGLGAAVLVGLAFVYGSAHGWLLATLMIGAVLLLGGCPACWLTGLLDAVRAKRGSDAAATD